MVINEQMRQTGRMIWLGVGLTLALLLLALLLGLLRLRQAGGPALPVIGPVADFTLTNQAGRTVTLGDLRGHVWLADIIFTRCAGPCLRMTKQMKDLEAALPRSGSVRLVTLTTDPDFDTPQVLQAYARRFELDLARWDFLTGGKDQIAALARDSLKLTALPKAPETQESPADLFIHSTYFVLVDKRGNLRGVFETEGEGVNPTEVRRRILNAARRLERES